MTEFLPYSNIFMIFQIATIFLVGTILFFTVKAYRITKETFLLTFMIGFILLEISAAFVLLNRLFGQTAVIYHIYITTFSKAKKRMQLLSDILIPSGFITLTAGQIFWVYWGFTDTNISLLLANLLFAIGLGFLSTSLLRIWRN